MDAVMIMLMTSVLDDLIVYVIKAAGCCALLKKCGRRPWLGLIPAVCDYEIAVAVEKEEEGRIYFILSALMSIFTVIQHYYQDKQVFNVMFGLIVLALSIAYTFYGVRIYLGLCHTFERSRKWCILWVLFDPVMKLVWGFAPSFKPVHKIVEMDYDKAAAISNATVEDIKHGLTVNLTERTARDFLKKKVLLRDIHLSIPTGHMVLLLGGSGAGKTTFLNAVTGYEQADAEVILNGSNVYNNYESMKYDLGFVPQQDLMRTNDTVLWTLNNAASLRLPKTMSATGRSERVKQMLEKFGLTSVASSLVGKLSGGQRKRLSIAMEFISDPSLFILDEPDSGLDGIVARNLFESLRSIADEGKIVIVITHTPDRVIDLFDDVIVLAKDAGRTGRLAFYGPVKEACGFFDKKSMEEILLSINQKDEGGEGRADEFIENYGKKLAEAAG